MPQFSYHGTIIEGILFDLDGTLYNQKKMQAYMLRDLFLYYVIRPHKLHEIRIIYYFRKLRYTLPAHTHLEQSQYDVVADFLKIPVQEVRKIIIFWMEERPLRYIKKCRKSFIVDLFKKIRSKNIKIGVVSDYPVEKKLSNLELVADIMIYAGDKDVDCLKPNPKGFLMAAEKLHIHPENCIVIGDRYDKDGIGAKNAGMFFIEIHKGIIKIFDDTK